ncbi:hypothetical protein BACFIN_09148 [Bacteroides finegoldii DSM 17565]|nr:hypothetical protein BACFIN_09148 [Bacteroides finegoldii DSM 17565]
MLPSYSPNSIKTNGKSYRIPMLICRYSDAKTRLLSPISSSIVTVITYCHSYYHLLSSYHTND